MLGYSSVVLLGLDVTFAADVNFDVTVRVRRQNYSHNFTCIAMTVVWFTLTRTYENWFYLATHWRCL